MHRILQIIAVAMIVGLAWAGGAQAALVGYTLTIDGEDPNNPDFILVNDSTSAQINFFQFTIGNTAFNFDDADPLEDPLGGTTIRTIGDGANGGDRTDLFRFEFTGFDPGEFFRSDGDIDPDSSNQVEDFRRVFFNNSFPLNSVITVGFTDQVVLNLTLPDDGNDRDIYVFSQSVGAIVPLPGALPLAATAFGVFGFVAWLRKRRQS